MSDGKPLSASMHRTMAHRVLPTYSDILRRGGGGELLDNTGLQAVRPELLPGVLAAFIGALTNNAAAEEDGREGDEQLKRLTSLVLVGQQVDGGPLSILVGYLADVLVTTCGH